MHGTDAVHNRWGTGTGGRHGRRCAKMPPSCHCVFGLSRNWANLTADGAERRLFGKEEMRAPPHA